MKKIIFVCTGNTCRSIMAEGLMKKLLKEAEENDEIPKREFKVESRGIFVANNDPANEKAIAVMEEFGVDITNHKAKQISLNDVEDSYLILTMTEEHKHVILLNWNFAESKVFALKEYAEMAVDQEEVDEPVDYTGFNIRDPYRGTYNDYEEVAEEIYEALLKVIDKLKVKVKEKS